MTTPTNPFLTGQWSDNTSWEFYLSEILPDAKLCSSVSCLAITLPEERIVLTKIHSRSWEMLGGHIEPGESLEEALHREALEEGGFTVQRSKLYGYLKITSRVPVVNDHHGGTYPLITYIPQFLVYSDIALVKPSGIEVAESGVFTAMEISALGIGHEGILLAGLEVHASK